MYVPAANAVDEDQIRGLLSTLRLGCLITHDAGGFFASHLPFVYDPGRQVLQGHLALANPHAARAGETDALVVFQGLDAYVSPNWYPSKQAHGRVVPTWNYEAAHVHGRLTWTSDPVWLLDLLSRLTNRFEADQPRPWAVTDAPQDHLDRQIRGIVGLEIAIERVDAKRKLSQNRDEADRLGVAAGLAASHRPGDQAVSAAMKALDR